MSFTGLMEGLMEVAVSFADSATATVLYVILCIYPRISMPTAHAL